MAVADITASGWAAGSATDGSGAAVQVLRTWRPWGPQGGRHALVQLNFAASNFGDASGGYPTNGIPAPNPSLVGFRDHISYIIPVSPFFRKKGPGVLTGPVIWGCVPPTYGASTGTAQVNTCFIRVMSPFTVTGSASDVQLKMQEAASSVVVSTLFSSDVMTAYAVFVEG